jgi:hypothetical protein
MPAMKPVEACYLRLKNVLYAPLEPGQGRRTVHAEHKTVNQAKRASRELTSGGREQVRTSEEPRQLQPVYRR